MKELLLDSTASNKKILVTGVAGFIGFYTAKRLLDQGFRVVGIDNLNDYYSVLLKKDRLKTLESEAGFEFELLDVADGPALHNLFTNHSFYRVVHLAAQAGVRYSIENPSEFVQSNLVGFANLLEECRHGDVEHLVFASSSSVYGANTKMPFSEHDSVNHPVSFYAATKKANEAMAHSYAHLYGLPVTGLRFFTVYGPWGRPDMAPMLFASAITENRPIYVFNEGKMKRDFTYVDDIADAISRTLFTAAEPNPGWEASQPDPASSYAPYRIYNIGNNKPIELMDFISLMEESLGRKAQKVLLPPQPGDVIATYADTDGLFAAVGFRPSTPVEEGIAKFASWYLDYFQPK